MPSDDPTLSGLSSVLSHRGTPPLRHVEDLLVAYARLPWLRAVVGKIGFSTASIPWKLYVQASPGAPMDALGMPLGSVRSKALQRAGFAVRQKMIRRMKTTGDLVEIENHVSLDLMDKFNGMMTGLSARKLTQVHLDLVGEAFWLKQRDPLGVVIGLWPIPPPWIRNTPTPSRPFYRLEFSSWKAEVPVSEMVWFCELDPHRPYWRGKGTAEALGDELETDEYAAKHTKVEFYNRGVPELLVTAENMGDDETRRLEVDWKQRNRGIFKALQVYFLNRKVDVKQLGQSFKSLQLIQLRQFERDMVIQVFGVPPEILGIIEKSNRATIDAADFLFARWVLVPRMEMQREVMQEMLISEFDERLILDYESPIKEDFERQLAAAKATPWNMKMDEWRVMQGQEPLPDGRGDIFWVPQNMIPVRDPSPAVPDDTGLPVGKWERRPAERLMEKLPTVSRPRPRLVYDEDKLKRARDRLRLTS